MTFCYPQHLSYKRTKNNPRGVAKVTAEIEGPEMEAALVEAYDLGVGALSPDRRKLLDHFLADVVLRVKGKL